MIRERERKKREERVLKKKKKKKKGRIRMNFTALFIIEMREKKDVERKF